MVEIDESKFGKRKYHRGDRVDGVWVIGGVERTKQRRVFLTTVSDRTASTIADIITRFVLPGSIIYTDCWRAYNVIEQLGHNIRHYTVNHSQNFTAIHEDGTHVHTNTIEGNYSFFMGRNYPKLTYVI